MEHDKSIKELNLEIQSMCNKIESLKALIEKAIITAIDEIAKKHAMNRIGEHCFIVRFSDLIGSVWSPYFYDWEKSAKIIKKFLENKPPEQWVSFLTKKLQDRKDKKIVIFEYTKSYYGCRDVTRIPVSAEFIELIIKHLQ